MYTNHVTSKPQTDLHTCTLLLHLYQAIFPLKREPGDEATGVTQDDGSQNFTCVHVRTIQGTSTPVPPTPTTHVENTIKLYSAGNFIELF